MKKAAAIGLTGAVATVLVLGLSLAARRLRADRGQLVLYGNVDLRQIELSFNDSDRIAAVLVEEGERVRPGQVVARLDTGRLAPAMAEAAASAAARAAEVERLHHGSRPEEVAQAQANVALARADAANAELQWRRADSLSRRTTGQAISRQDLDSARAGLDMARARLAAAEKARDLAVAGPRSEDVAAGEAELRAAQARLELLRRELADAELRAPAEAIVRSRLLEPGEMASPQRPVLDLAVTEPKWVRAYVSETDLGRIHPGAQATVTADGFPGRTFPGWVGFISSVAEFTPKTVQTEDLRTNLVYEVRIFVRDPEDVLRLGMPATVRIGGSAGPT